MKSFRDRFIAIVLSILALESAAAQATIPLVDIKSVDPTIAIELRYSGSNNLAGRALYSRGTPALVRPEVASRLVRAQAFLGRYLYRLKIWDAYRPKSVQAQLWQVARNNDYVADPETGAGSMHTWGVAVDATLTDACNHFVRMPTDFDELTPAAMLHYQGSDPTVSTQNGGTLSFPIGKSMFQQSRQNRYQTNYNKMTDYSPGIVRRS